MLPKQAIFEYQHLYKKVYGISLTTEEASMKANDFMHFFKTIYKPIKKSWVNKDEKNRVKK